MRTLITIAVLSLCGPLVQPTSALALEPPKVESEDNDEDKIPVIKTPAELRNERRRVLALRAHLKQFAIGSDQTEIRLHQTLKEKLISAQAAYDLNATEAKKLALAGYGGIKHAMDCINECQTRRAWLAFNANNGQEVQAETNKIQEQLNDQNLYGENSLYGKTLKRIVAQKKRTPHAERDAHELEAMLQSVSIYLGSASKLRDDQQKPIIELLQRRIQNSPVIIFHETEDLCQRLIEIPDEEYAKVLDQEQLRKLRKHLDELQGILALKKKM